MDRKVCFLPIKTRRRKPRDACIVVVMSTITGFHPYRITWLPFAHPSVVGMTHFLARGVRKLFLGGMIKSSHSCEGL